MNFEISKGRHMSLYEIVHAFSKNMKKHIIILFYFDVQKHNLCYSEEKRKN